ncbi:uncharacterized protein LOC124493419 [Dermatophagoides farinae]|uniref:uncharacterized protein LOC124493419 n=1 Tax=Dermatophagoides farinae TaxID=6954 RepID=UPI003F5DD59B
MAESRFGILYVITRILLVVLIVIMIVLNIIAIINAKGEVKDVVWVVFSFISLLIGLLGVWKEHFLFSCLFTVITIVLVCISGAFGFWISTAGAVVIIIAAIIYTFMLWDMGHREMNVPDMC